MAKNNSQTIKENIQTNQETKNALNALDYDKTLKQATAGATDIASQATRGAIDSQNATMRSNGMGGNAAAIMAGNNAANSYNQNYINSLAEQQQAALNTAQNKANLLQAEQQNVYNRAVAQRDYGTNLGLGIAQTALSGAGSLMSAAAGLSDENMKTDIQKVSYSSIMDGVGEKLKRKTRKFSDLKWEAK